MDDLLQDFVAETRETLEALSGEIVAWETTPDDRARLDAIFRFVHTVKGSCGFLDLPRLARLSHAAEDVLAAVRDGIRAPDTALVNAVLAVVDRIGEIVEAIDAGHALDDSSEDLLIAALAEDAAPVDHARANPNGVTRAANRSIRLNVDLLDRMMSGMSEMVLARNELARRLRDGAPDPRAEAALERLSLTVGEMRDAVTRTRMQRIEALFSALPRMVRDTAAALNKTVTLSIDGGDVELDREMVEMLRDPLVHIVRNAIDHGIEAPAVRRAIGKPEAGCLSVSARQSGNQILVEIADDGAGIDVAAVAAKAVRVGLCNDAAVAVMSERQRLDLIFAPGLSSRETVTATSGRGVGMDVVRANIEQIGGRVTLDNRPGRGLVLCIEVPLTLSIIPTIVVGAGAQRFALPRQTVEEIVPLSGDTVRIDTLGSTEVATVRGERLGLVGLADILGIDGHATMLAIVTTRSGRYALGIDTVLDVEELVIKPAAPAVMGQGIYAGQTLPDSGLPMLLLDGTGIAAAAGLSFADSRTDAVEAEAAVAVGVPALLFDDLDGARRLIALAAIDRVETAAVGSIHRTAGGLRLAVGEQLVPLRHRGDVDPAGAAVVLRVSDGTRQLGYAIAEPLDIVPLPTDWSPIADVDGITGIAMLDGVPVELVDAHALLAVEDAAAGARRPVCLLHADADGWMTGFLRPMLEAAGYHCVEMLLPGECPALALAMSDAAVPEGVDGGVLIRLRRERAGGADTLYRYDRAGLAAVIDERLAGGMR